MNSFSAKQSRLLVSSLENYCNELLLEKSQVKTSSPIYEINDSSLIQLTNNSFSINLTSSDYGTGSSNSPNSSSYSSIKSPNETVCFPRTTKKQLPIRSKAIDMSEFLIETRGKNNKIVHCSFCKSNNESEEIYMSHSLKDSNGRVTCPILKLHKCPICNESGENAHTITYCKEYKRQKINKILSNI